MDEKKKIIIIKPKSLNPNDKGKLTKAGNIVVECANPSDIVFRNSTEPMEFSKTNCAQCGERIYILAERMNALKSSGYKFYCTHGHENRFVAKKANP